MICCRCPISVPASAVIFLLGSAVPPLPAGAAPEVKAIREGTQIVFRAGAREMLRYQAEPSPLPRPDIRPEFQRGGYLDPLFTPGGASVADDYPPNHIHPHGVWWPSTGSGTATAPPG